MGIVNCSHVDSWIAIPRGERHHSIWVLEQLVHGFWRSARNSSQSGVFSDPFLLPVLCKINLGEFFVQRSIRQHQTELEADSKQLLPLTLRKAHVTTTYAGACYKADATLFVEHPYKLATLKPSGTQAENRMDA